MKAAPASAGRITGTEYSHKQQLVLRLRACPHPAGESPQIPEGACPPLRTRRATAARRVQPAGQQQPRAAI